MLAKSFFVLLLLSSMLAPAYADVQSAVDNQPLGLFNSDEFRLSNGHCTDCNATKQALWYFQDDVVATPIDQPVGFDAGLRAQEDVQTNSLHDKEAKPSLIWLGSPHIAAGSLSADGATLNTPEQAAIPFSVVPKIATNLSYYNDSSVRYFAGRALHARGNYSDGQFIARTLWPDDFALDFASLKPAELVGADGLQAMVRLDGKQPAANLEARVLWQRDAANRNWNGKPVLAFMLNGAQGDDDEAHGGHFAIATGEFGAQGQWGDWLVNNFYNLGSVSEKGIIAATLPMDAYMADLNSGQSWYRPSFMLVAVLNKPRASQRVQSALGRVYQHFYRQDFVYRHATANCAGISMDTLRTLGWNIPALGPTNALKAVVALPFMAAKELSLSSGEQAFDYLMAEQTNLYPFVSFDAIGQDLLERISHAGPVKGELESMLAEDLDALIYVRIPQFPSSRVWGQAPIASLDEYMSRVPENRADWKIIPVAPRPFPDQLKDPNAPAQAWPPSRVALCAYAGALAIFLVWLASRWSKRKAKK